MNKWLELLWKAWIVVIICVITLYVLQENVVNASENLPLKRVVNIPYLGAGSEHVELFEPTVFWFGQVTPTINNADVRLWYYDDYIKGTVHIIDRRVWRDDNPTLNTLEEWDAVSIYLNLDGPSGHTPTLSSYRLVAQLGGGINRQGSYKGNGTDWTHTPITWTAETSWRGQGYNNNENDKGWQLTFYLPFSSLNLAAPPPEGTKWGISVVVHDRDEVNGLPAIIDQVWPENVDTNMPSTWGILNFGVPRYSKPTSDIKGTSIIRHELNGAIVKDGHAGGHGNCGSGLDHWTEWGEKVYLGWTSINIQNQWDISDYPCFSKYFITFPLEQVPAGKSIIDAKLTMHRFGNAGGGDWGIPEDSHIIAFSVMEDWLEESLNWNNAPLALEHISSTWVPPTQTSPQQRFDWDVSQAVNDAYINSEPARLALYATDGERHSGKYFMSSENTWALDGRPTLTISWGDICDDCISPTPTDNLSPSPDMGHGDTNNDGKVDILDYSTLITEFGSSGDSLSADFNEDGRVDILDYSVLVANFGK